eukprot:gene2889-1415_t
MSLLAPRSAFFYHGPWISIDEGQQSGCPWAGGAIVNASGKVYQLATPGSPVDSNLALWFVLLCIPGVTRGDIPVFYDAQSPADKVRALARELPQWNRRSISGHLGPRLAFIFAVLRGAALILCIKVASHIASVPNGQADRLVPAPIWKEGNSFAAPERPPSPAPEQGEGAGGALTASSGRRGPHGRFTGWASTGGYQTLFRKCGVEQSLALVLSHHPLVLRDLQHGYIPSLWEELGWIIFPTLARRRLIWAGVDRAFAHFAHNTRELEQETERAQALDKWSDPEWFFGRIVDAAPEGVKIPTVAEWPIIVRCERQAGLWPRTAPRWEAPYDTSTPALVYGSTIPEGSVVTSGAIEDDTHLWMKIGAERWDGDWVDQRADPDDPRMTATSQACPAPQLLQRRHFWRVRVTAEGHYIWEGDEQRIIHSGRKVCGHGETQFLTVTADPMIALYEAMRLRHFRKVSTARLHARFEIVRIDLDLCPEVKIVDLRTSDALRLLSQSWGSDMKREGSFPDEDDLVEIEHDDTDWEMAIDSKEG